MIGLQPVVLFWGTVESLGGEWGLTQVSGPLGVGGSLEAMSAFEQTNKTKPQVDLRPPQTGRYSHMHIPNEDTSTYVAHRE